MLQIVVLHLNVSLRERKGVFLILNTSNVCRGRQNKLPKIFSGALN